MALKLSIDVKKILFSLFFILLSFQTIHAEESILISKSNSMENIVFDGKWTSKSEWKESVHQVIGFGENKIVHLRTAHHQDFVYFMLDFVSDTTPATNMDRAIICLNSDDDKSKQSDSDDFCFITTLNGKSSHVMIGGNNNALNGNFKKIQNDFSFIGIGTVSDKNDRYSIIPHASYEFKIPTELIGRSSTYGFYFSLYDHNENKSYSWPSIPTENNFSIPSPSMWGSLISPDKSLPEFSFSSIFYVLIPTSIVFLLIINSKIFTKINY